MGTQIATARTLTPEARENFMTRQIRDLVVTLAALGVLFTMLITIDPRLRDRAGQLTGSVSTQQWETSRYAVNETMGTAVSIVSGYANDNIYLFAFLVVAAVLFVLMLRT
jgi:hypothetical protein